MLTLAVTIALMWPTPPLPVRIFWESPAEIAEDVNFECERMPNQ